jgi:hypothetical protein
MTPALSPRRPAQLFASQMSTAQTTTNKATLRRFQSAMNTGDAETISKTIDETEGGNR